MERIEVTCAIIINDKKIMACRRSKNTERASKWEFPGGKVEAGETLKQCIVRELKEELHIEAEAVCQLAAVDFNYPDREIKLIPFVCEIKSGIPVALEHDKIEWINAGNFETLNWSEADKELFYKNKEDIECWLY